MTTNEYLDLIKKNLKLRTDAELSRKLKITKQAISQYRSERSHIDSDVILTVSDILKIPVAKILFDIKAEKSTSYEAKKKWIELSKEVKTEDNLYIMLSSKVEYLIRLPWCLPGTKKLKSLNYVPRLI
jgi:transcriptional regulator with XRE-family HTH domain